MNKQLELEAEAEEYADYNNEYIPLSFGGKYNESHKRTFIAGANSKYVERQKLEFAISLLLQLRSAPISEIDNKVFQLEKKLSEI